MSPELALWSPCAEPFPWNGSLGQLVDTVWRTSPDRLAPGAELAETDEAFVLELDLPGVDKDHIIIDVTDRRVSVHARRTEKQRTGVLRHSTRTTGSYGYDVTLPTAVDEMAVTAALDGGVLTVRMPKASGAKATRVVIE